ncbi:MAG: hypothetical protein BalsKO_11650 [Balneolaceae bacterium]
MYYIKTLFLICFFSIQNEVFAQDPSRFQNEVDALVEKEFEIDSTKPIAVFTGSSSVRLWNNLSEVFPSVNTINTGFGGSHASDLIFYLDELVLRHSPDIIFIYEGDNDIAASKTRITILPEMTRLVTLIKKELPDAEIYFISPKPSIARWSFKEDYEYLNGMLETVFRNTEGVTFIDVWNPMLNESGEPRADIFIEDNLHMNAKGYEIWTEVIGKATGFLDK